MRGGILRVKDFSLKHTLESGQFFNYKKLGDIYKVLTKGKVITLKQKGSSLYYDGTSESFVKTLFGLNQNFTKITKELQKDKYVKKAIKQYPGLRIMRYDPWECTIGFVCSANANIPKIRKNIELLSEYFGKKIKQGKEVCYLFPNVGKLNNLSKIKKAKTGYRASYIFCINKEVSDSYFKKIDNLDYEMAHKELMKLKGIGPKVADCILLFAFNKFEAFPVDTHVKQIMQELYFKGKEVSNKKIKEFALEHFGKYGGYAQQYLFYSKRKRK